MSQNNNSIKEFVKQDTYHKFHNSWEGTSQQKMESNDLQRRQGQQEMNDKSSLEERRKRASNSVPRTHIPVDAETLSRDLGEQMRLKEERIQQLKEEERLAEQRRLNARNEQYQREEVIEQQRLMGRKQFYRDLEEQRQQGRQEREENTSQKKLEQRQSLADNHSEMKIWEKTRQHEAEQKKSEAFEDMIRVQDQQKAKKDRALEQQWSSFIPEKDERQDIASSKARLHEEQQNFLEEQRADRQNRAKIEAEQSHQVELECQEVDRVQAQRQGALQAAQKRLGEQVTSYRNQQIQDKVLIRQREDKERDERVELGQLQAEEWKTEEEKKRKAVREKQLAYSQQLKEQIEFKASQNRSNF